MPVLRAGDQLRARVPQGGRLEDVRAFRHPLTVLPAQYNW